LHICRIFRKSRERKKKLRGLNLGRTLLASENKRPRGARDISEQAWAKAHLAPDLQKMEQKGEAFLPQVGFEPRNCRDWTKEQTGWATE
jgi:hypothetical protein